MPSCTVTLSRGGAETPTTLGSVVVTSPAKLSAADTTSLTSSTRHASRLHLRDPGPGNRCACHPQSRADARRCGPMTDLLQVLPDLDARPYSHLLPSLDRAFITTNDLLTLEAADVAKRAQLPAGEVRKLADGVVLALHRQLGFGGGEVAAGSPEPAQKKWNCISTLDETLDAALGGGIPPGYVVEVTGER